MSNLITTTALIHPRVRAGIIAARARGTFETKDEGAEPTLAELKAAIDGYSDTTGKAFGTLKTRLDNIEKRLNRPGAPTPEREAKDAFAAESKALRTFVQSGNDTEIKAMSVGSDPSGGYLVLPEFSRTINKITRDLSPMRRLARVIELSVSGEYAEPIDRDDLDANWVGETTARPETSTPDLGMWTLVAEEIYACPKVTQRLLEDSAIDVGEWLSEKIGDKFARLEGQAFTNGNGVKKPRGFLTHPTAATVDFTRPWGTIEHVNSGSATAITADGLTNLAYSLRTPYRANARWLLSRDTARQISLLKDTTGQYLWREGLAAGQPPTLLGFPVEFVEEMPAIGAGALPVAFGDWRKAYTIVDRLGLKLLRDPFTAKPHVLFYTYKRVGGAVVDFNALKLQKIAA